MKFPAIHWLGRSDDTGVVDDKALTVRQLWDRERAHALTPAHRAEIDAIFSRYA